MATARPRDPREIITPDAFTVAPELLGKPLARPRQRLAAILLDVLVLVIVIKAFGVVFLPLVAALLFLRVSQPARTGGLLRRGAARALQLAGVILIVVFVIQAWGRLRDLVTRDRAPGVNVQRDNDDGESLRLSVRDFAALRLVQDFGEADNEAEARTSAAAIADWIMKRSDAPAERADFARLALDALDDEDHLPILEQTLAPILSAAPRTEPPLDPVLALADALERGDTAAADSLRAPAAEALAGPRIARLTSERDSLQERNRELQRGRRGIRRILSGLADDLGVGFGWFAVYFTAFGVLWKGQTPGKRALGLRIIRLDGRPLSWWLSFERFGGYAASFSTGLLGFAQILWDRNRQGLHDKAVETVVISEPRGS